MDRLEQIKNKIERAKTYGVDMGVSMADVEWLIGETSRLRSKVEELELDREYYKSTASYGAF